ALSQRHLAWFCVTCGKLPLFGSPRLLALGIGGLFSVLTLGTDWIATTPAGDEWVTQEIIAVRQFTRPSAHRQGCLMGSARSLRLRFELLDGCSNDLRRRSTRDKSLCD